MKKTIAYSPQGSGGLGSDSHKLQCSLCGEVDRNKLLVEDICIGYGMGGDEYCFCDKCWNSKNLGKNILSVIGAGDRLKYQDHLLTTQEVDI